MKKRNKNWNIKRRNSFYKNKKKEKARIKIMLLLLSFIAFLSVIIYFLFFSNFFRVKNIQAEGNEKINYTDIIDITSQDFKNINEYYIPNNNFFMLKEEYIENSLKDNFSEIEEVVVEKKLPDSLYIKIKEKESALIWCRNECFFVNEDGIAFMKADEKELIEKKQSFIKIIEEEILTEEEIEEENEEVEDVEKSTEEIDENLEIDTKTNQIYKEDIKIDDKVSDRKFIDFAVDINKKISYNSKLSIKFYKTSGTETRELVAFTDKNTKIYFDTTKDLDNQLKNLNYLVSKELEQSQVDELDYIYLKNQDRIFYK